MIGEGDLKVLSGFAALAIPENKVKTVLENLQRLEQVAGVLNAIELGPEDELGPEWRP